MSDNPTHSPFGAVGLEDIFLHAPCGYLVLDADGKILRANKLLESWTGSPAPDLAGKRLPDLLRVSGRIFHETHLLPLLRMQGFVNEIALDLKSADGGSVQVLINAVERRDAIGTTVGTYIIMFPAGERRRYERTLVDAQDALELGLRSERETGALRDQFIAVLGHDLRNPLAAVSSAVRMLGRETLSERGRKVIDLMQGSVARMAGLIDDVLDFARGSLGSGIGIALQQEGALAQVITQVVDELRSGHPDRVIDMDVDITSAVQCDRGRIGQLVSNLVGNALAHGSSQIPVSVQAYVSDGALEITVRNGGDPISEVAAKRLFQPFFRGDNQDRSQGLGLGLYIASEIAKAHGGTLSVSSSQSETRFTFRMPC